ncbi:MAG: YggS family pyridoxal phosphate-dependent enzyme [Rikenellaceae bacterium]
MSIKQNINSIISLIPKEVKLVAISKTKPCEAIMEAYDTGQRIFGENRHKELIEKFDTLPKDIKWHFIGSLQRTNVKYVVPRVELIHSVDSHNLLKEIDKEAAKNSKVMDVLLELHIAQEMSKSGWDRATLIEYLKSGAHSELKNVRIVGVMSMASYTYDTEQIRAEFRELKQIFDSIKEQFFADSDYFNTISAGMSGDYEIAIEEGSNMVRIGSTIFNA